MRLGPVLTQRIRSGQKGLDRTPWWLWAGAAALCGSAAALGFPSGRGLEPVAPLIALASGGVCALGVAGFRRAWALRTTGQNGDRWAASFLRGGVPCLGIVFLVAIAAVVGDGLVADPPPRRGSDGLLEALAYDKVLLTSARYAALVIVAYIVVSIFARAAQGRFLRQGAGFAVDDARRLGANSRQASTRAAQAIALAERLDRQLKLTSDELMKSQASLRTAQEELAGMRGSHPTTTRVRSVPQTASAGPAHEEPTR